MPSTCSIPRQCLQFYLAAHRWKEEFLQNAPVVFERPLQSEQEHERVTELCGEGHRWEDLVRWGDLSTALAARDAGFANYQPKYALLPIPQYDIDVNANLKQNPGW